MAVSHCRKSVLLFSSLTTMHGKTYRIKKNANFNVQPNEIGSIDDGYMHVFTAGHMYYQYNINLLDIITHKQTHIQNINHIDTNVCIEKKAQTNQTNFEADATQFIIQ